MDSKCKSEFVKFTITHLISKCVSSIITGLILIQVYAHIEISTTVFIFQFNFTISI